MSVDPTAVLLQSGLFATPLGRVLLVLIAVAVVVLVGRVLLTAAWRTVTIGAVVVAVLFVLATLGPF